ADENAGVRVMVLHADAIPEHGAAAVGTGRVDGQNPNLLAADAKSGCELTDQRTLTGSGRPRDAERECASGVWKERAQQRVGARVLVLDDGSGAGDGANVS